MSGTNANTSLKDYCPVMQLLASEMGVPPSNPVFDLGRDDEGCDFKVYGATSGVYMEWDESADRLKLVGIEDEVLDVDVTPHALTAGERQGAINVYVNRTADYAMTSWDGNPDCGLKMQVYNRAVNTTSRGAVRGLDILARNRDSGSLAWINGGTVTAENSTGSGGVDSLYGFEVHVKNNGVASGTVCALRVYDESQSATGTNYAISIDCTNNSPFTREYCIHINSGASSGWTNGITFDGNITNVLDFADTDGTNGATYNSGGTYTPGNLKGKIQIDIGGNTMYLAAYDGMT